MLGLLTKHGYTLTDDETQADVIVINTCCFIHDAKEESINTILEMAQYKEQNLKALVVAGCLAERYKDEILEEIPEIDAVLGTTSYDSIVEAVNTALEENAGEHFEHYESIDYLPDNSNVERVVTTGNHMAYLKIAEGCDKRCSYCIIPKIRGHFRSVPMEELLNEAKRLASEGVKELVLVAQETTLYGKDLTGEKQLPLLLHELCKIEGIEWIRLLYCYPEEITDELIEVIKTEEKVCNYIDMPIQHSENRILQRMGRRTSREDLVAVIKKLRKEIPDITIRTTLITGFPGESQEDHEGLMNFVEECKFDRLGVFTYSPEEDTLAATFEDQIDEEVKEAVLAAAKTLEEKGAIVEEFDLGLVEYAIPAYYVIAAAEASSNLSRFDGVKYGYRAKDYEGLHNMYKKTRSEGFGAEVKRRIMLGSFVLSSGYYDAYYLKALRTKALIKKEFDKAFEKYDVILGPVAPTTAPKLGDSLSDPIKMYLGDIYTISVNLAGLPGISLPCGKDKNGLPIGLQLIGNCFEEKKIIRAAYAFEQTRTYEHSPLA